MAAKKTPSPGQGTSRAGKRGKGRPARRRKHLNTRTINLVMFIFIVTFVMFAVTYLQVH
jgi:hypothetical protein